MSETSAKEFIETISSVLETDIIEKMQNSPFISLLCDESTDVSTSKNLVLYVDGQTIATALLCFLEIHGIPVAKVVGLGSNGAAVMTGKGKGVTGLLLNQNPLMINIHCIAHRLALVTEQAAKDIPGINDIKDTIVRVWIGLKLCYDNNLHKRAHEVIELIYIDLWSGDELIEAKVRLLKLRDEAVICHNQYSEMLSDEDADKEEAWIVDLEDAINQCVHDNRVKEMTVSTLPLERFVQPNSADGPPPELLALSNSLNANHLGSGIRLEKAKLPSFDGSIRDYPTFKEEFGVHVNGNVPGSTAAMLLRGCLGPGPKATVRGLGLDYIEMWKELDANYGNPRLVSDAVLADIDRFRELKEGDNQRFIEYVNVIQAGYHVLKQVGRPGDIDNNAMLSRIEQKLAYDMKVEWSRHLEQLRVENQKVQDLLEWLETEKRTRIRTFAAVRNPCCA
ncbi:Zinc finger protein 862 [Nymphon striatum]|nr:Zinc finger protein 862 [Nymphon striatum]